MKPDWQCGDGGVRLWQRFRAVWGGYFWMPCPVCHRKFGGHEWKIANRIHNHPDAMWRGSGVCSAECRDLFNNNQQQQDVSG